MNAKYMRGITLTLLLVAGGPAQALTGQEAIDGFMKGFVLTDFFKDPLGSLLTGVAKGGESVASLGVGKVIGDVASPFLGTTKSVQNSPAQFVLSGITSSATLMKKQYDLLNKNLAAIIERPFDKAPQESFKKTVNDTMAEQNKFYLATNNLKEIPGVTYVDPAGKIIRNQIGTADTADVTMAVGNDKLKVAQAYKLADLATNEEAVALNDANRKRMLTAATTLVKETDKAVSTRATVQALNVAISSLMAQEVYGNERLQERLNLMLLQGARTNDQIGDLVNVFRKEDAQKIKDYNSRVEQAEKEAKRYINNFNTTYKTNVQSLTDAQTPEVVVKDSVSIGDSSGPDGTGPNSATGPMPPEPGNTPYDGTIVQPRVGITVPSSPQAPTPVQQPTPKEDKTGDTNPLAPVDRNAVASTDLANLGLSLNPGEGGKTKPPIPPTSDPYTSDEAKKKIEFGTPEYEATREYREAREKYDAQLIKAACAVRIPYGKNCNNVTIRRPLSPEILKRITAVDPDEVNVLLDPLW